MSTAARAKLVLVGDAHQLAPVKARGGMFEQLCDELPWTQRLSEVWRMRDTEERHASLALRRGRGNRLRTAIGWYRNHDRLHTGDAVAMAADATTGYISARSEGKDAAILCDRWEITDAINNKLHHHYRGDGDATTVTAARDHQIAAGDIILSRHNDASITVAPGPDHKRGDRIDQVRNGNRWRVAWVDADAGQIAAERLTDNARAIFEGDYRREHITLGYATTVHAAQGMPVGNDRTRGVCWALLSDRASRSMAYVGMTRARDENHLGIYPAVLNEVDTEQTSQMRRGTKHQAAAVLHTIATANDDRPRTMTAEAAHADRALLPTAIAALLDDHDERRASRAHAWQRHITRENAREAAYQRFAETNQQAAQRRRSKDRDRGYGLEP